MTRIDKAKGPAKPRSKAKARTKNRPKPPPGLDTLVESVTRLETFDDTIARLERDRRARLGGMWGAAFSLVLAALVRARAGWTVVVTPNVDEAEDLDRDLRLFGFSPDDVHLIAPVDGPSGDGQFADARLLSRNLRSLRARMERPNGVLLIPLAAMVRPVPSRRDLAEANVTIAQGMEIDRDRWLERLGASGMDRVDLVAAPGEFSVRGEILDVFALSEDAPVRIELDGDWIDSIRRIDPSTQRSTEVIEEITLPWLGKSAIVEGAHAAAHWLDYVERDDLVVVRNPTELEERADRYDFDEAVAALLFADDGATARLEASALPVSIDGHSGNVSVGSITAEGADLTSAMQLLGRLCDSSRRIVLFCQSDAEGNRFGTLLARQLPEAVGKVEIRTGNISHGFQFHDLGIVLVDHHELFHRTRPRRAELPESPPSLPIDDHMQLKKGDAIVHAIHGIARYRGLERMASGESEQEFLNLEFAGGMRLYVPISKIHWIERYVGSKGHEPRLSKLGGAGWAKKKKLVEDSVTEFAGKLLRVMAIRSKRQGFSFPPDTEWQHEFEAAFPYKDTPDQHEAAVLTKRDMEDRAPMDRLICGDVGYGKTEIAMRAAFKCVEAGKQVAMLVPTTVLAQQHLQTFQERMSDYPVEIDVLSRFRTAKESRRVLERAANGHVDILIGTHRLLQKDVAFKDLGLVIVDEEQRFGVGHKDRLMQFRATVDLLTLTATPIPRTLHMALVSLRDISTLETPPQGRQPIHTEIVPWQDEAIADAITHELERDGQIFFIHNRVRTIEKIKHKLESLVPLARIDYIHGQMDEHFVEERMTAFVEKRLDVLLATTIIESGLDIPNANTIFIDRADRFGLAELHQLRGRVGRYKNQAYAYLLVPPRAIISTEAKKRLKAIEEFSDLGAGFRIAMRDMEIRGAGNLLGPEQHGHIAAIGYELYCRLLRDAVKRMRGEKVEPRVETEIDLGVPALIPVDYVPDTRQKVEIYQKIAGLDTEDDIPALREECRDRFGPVPVELDNLFEITRARIELQKNRVEGVRRRGSRLILDVPVGLVPAGLAGRGKDEVRRVDMKTIHLMIPEGVEELTALVDGLVAALRGDGFF